ncbi:hypothetical protein GALL_489870 [mine drainage metagenome]|uniref:Uncharacterized protein n=1 Tax=mine drainage metagenome TaxID=410659 RepID=A0A1J5PPA2_9ZZZZ
MISYAITVPYEGIAALAHPLPATPPPPPNPLRHAWADGPSMTLDTGAAQAGAWLVHESASGDLQVQIVPDGVVRGAEQVPPWLPWVRLHLLTLAQALAAVGALVLVVGFFWPARGAQVLASAAGAAKK